MEESRFHVKKEGLVLIRSGGKTDPTLNKEAFNLKEAEFSLFFMSKKMEN